VAVHQHPAKDAEDDGHGARRKALGEREQEAPDDVLLGDDTVKAAGDLRGRRYDVSADDAELDDQFHHQKKDHH